MKSNPTPNTASSEKQDKVVDISNSLPNSLREARETTHRKPRDSAG
jgi:hypothetical protein